MPFVALPDLAKGPKYKRTGFAATSYIAGFLLDTMAVFIVGYIFACLFVYAVPSSFAVVEGAAFVALQLIGHAVFWAYLAFSFGCHKVRRWWLQVALHLWFAYVFQLAFFLPYVPLFEPALLNNEIAPYVWLCWALSVPLLVKSLGLCFTLHDALRIYYPPSSSAKGCWAVQRHWYFNARSAKVVYEALEQGYREALQSVSLGPEKRPLSYSVLTLSTHPNDPQAPAYLHLKDVFLGNIWPFKNAVHRCPGFSRIHQIELNVEQCRHLESLLG